MTFLIQRLNDNMLLPPPPGEGQTCIRITQSTEGVNASFQATLIARTEPETPVNPAKGIKRAQFDFSNFLVGDDDQSHAHLIQALGFAVFAAMNVKPDEKEERLIIT
jgi:hypothetical protein